MMTYKPLEADRMILRRWKEADMAPFAAINCDPLVAEFLGPSPTLEQATKWAWTKDAQFDQYGFGLYAAELKETGEMIGFIGCQVPPFDIPRITPCIEIGWRLGSAYWGKGLATEGAKAVIADMFSRPGISEIVSFTAVGNIRSQRVMQKIGMTTDTNDNFNHPKVAEDSPLRLHVLYRIKKT